MRIVLLGKTGAGKSSMAETIFGERVFEIHHTANPGTSRCQSTTREVHGRNITMVDTPGFFGSHRSEDDLRSSIASCIIECAPGPHAFLIVLKVERYAEQEKEVISRITQTFSEEAFRYSVVVFTHGDQLQEGMQIEEFVGGNEELHDLLQKCGGRCHVIDNKYWNNNPQDEYRNNQRQVDNLLNTITEMMNQNHGGFYTNEMLQAVEGIKAAEAENIQSSSPQMSQEDVRIEAEIRVYNFLKNAAGITAGMLLGALLGVPVMIAKVVIELRAMGIDVGKVAKGAAAAAGAAGATDFRVIYVAAEVAGAGATVAVVAVGAAAGGVTGYQKAVEAESITEAVRNTVRAIYGLAGQQFRNMLNSLKEKQRKQE